MNKIHELAHYAFAILGFVISVAHPVSGAFITVASLAAGVVYRLVSKVDLEKLATIVNANAMKLEQVIIQHEKLSNDFTFTQQAKGLGLR